MKRLTLFLSILFVVISVKSSWGQIPQTLSFQGILTDDQGNLQNGDFVFVFRLYDDTTSATSLWDEVQNLTVTNGIYNAIFGNITPLTLPFDKQYWVGVSINGGSELTPRTPLTSSPYSFNTRTTSSLPVPDFDSGWFIMESQVGVNSFKEIAHDLGVYPSQVKVLVKAIEGDNEGFIFEGMGSAQNDDDTDAKNYGGVIFAYDTTRVRLWAPDANNSDDSGSIIRVGDGWGGEVNSQGSHIAEVRVLVWK